MLAAIITPSDRGLQGASMRGGGGGVQVMWWASEGQTGLQHNLTEPQFSILRQGDAPDLVEFLSG